MNKIAAVDVRFLLLAAMLVFLPGIEALKNLFAFLLFLAYWLSKQINFERLYVVGKWYGMFACLISIIQLATHIQLLKASQNPLVAQSM